MRWSPEPKLNGVEHKEVISSISSLDSYINHHVLFTDCAMLDDKWLFLILGGGGVVLLTYACLVGLFLFGNDRQKKAAGFSAGTLFDSQSSTLVWGLSAGAAVVSVLVELIYLLVNAYGDAYDPFFEPLLLFFMCAALWAPLTFAVSFYNLPWILAALPVWGTGVANVLILMSVASVPADKTVLYFFWTVSAVHHIVMDGVIWVSGFYNNSRTTPDNSETSDERILLTTKFVMNRALVNDS